MIVVSKGYYTPTVHTVDFPTWVKKPSKCATHTHRHVLRARHGMRIIEDRTIRVDTRKRHSAINCISTHTELVR